MSARKPASEMRVLILGAGISAAFGVAALRRLHIGTIDVFTDKVSRPPAGAFWLHNLPADLRNQFQSRPIVTFGVGDEEGYIRNQYGYLLPQYSSSFPTQPKVDWGWDVYDVWSSLWEGANVTTNMPMESDKEIIQTAIDYDLVFHTFPTQVSKVANEPPISYPVLVFPSESFLATDNPYLGLEDWWLYRYAARCILQDTAPVAYKTHPHDYNVCLYNGLERLLWVRLTVRWGRIYVELPCNWADIPDAVRLIANPPTEPVFVKTLHPSTKPWTSQLASNIYPLGRFAQWDKTLLSHLAFSHVSGICKSYITDV